MAMEEEFAMHTIASVFDAVWLLTEIEQHVMLCEHVLRHLGSRRFEVLECQ
jgi:hypothetical protein